MIIFEQFLSILIEILEPIPGVKESTLINDWENIIAYCKGYEQSEALVKKFGLFQIQMSGLVCSKTPGICCNSYPHLSLETAFPALETTQNC